MQLTATIANKHTMTTRSTFPKVHSEGGAELTWVGGGVGGCVAARSVVAVPQAWQYAVVEGKAVPHVVQYMDPSESCPAFTTD